jgi:hypothetical protein
MIISIDFDHSNARNPRCEGPTLDISGVLTFQLEHRLECHATNVLSRAYDEVEST